MAGLGCIKIGVHFALCALKKAKRIQPNASTNVQDHGSFCRRAIVKNALKERHTHELHDR